MEIDIKNLIKLSNNRYDKFLKSKPSGYNTSFIENTVEQTISKLEQGVKSTVIYGQPQSGKTDMMIALCSKLFDSGTDIIIMLVQDIVELQNQNKTRFAEAAIEPAPVGYHEVIEPDYNLRKRKHLIFCRKNSNQLEKLLPHVKKFENMVIIDDETDYATPNSRVNKEEQTKINKRVTELVNKKNIFIGVTATPARNLANNTLDTDINNWIYFEPHEKYLGYEFFFPEPLNPDSFKYRLETLADESPNESRELREAFFNFCVNVAYLNLTIKDGQKEKNFIMLVHSTLKIIQHEDEKSLFVKIKSILSDTDHTKFEQYVKEIYKLAERLTKNIISDKHNITVDDIVRYIISNISRCSIAVLDTKGKKDLQDMSHYTTNPVHPFTVVIGGNTISRGLTFSNMLSMFFSRDVKGKMGQGTFIQRARMFGPREKELMPFFTLTIPLKLYKRWWSCFSMYDIMLQYLRSGHPLYVQTSDNQAVPTSSIDKQTVDIDSGVLGSPIIRYDDEIASMCDDFRNGNIDSLSLLKKFSKLDRPLIEDFLIERLINKGATKDSFMIHLPPHDRNIIENIYKPGNYDSKEIKRTAGGMFSGGMAKQYEKYDFVFWPLTNKADKVRLWFFDRKEDKKNRIKYFKNIRVHSKIVSYQ